MNGQDYLNEERYEEANEKVKTGGRIAMLIGIVMIIIGVFVIEVPEMGADGWFEASSTRMFLIMPGVFITIVGCVVRFIIANQRKITAYQIQSMRPLAEEGMEKVAPALGKTGSKIAKEMAPAYGEVAKEISKGIKEGLNSSKK